MLFDRLCDHTHLILLTSTPGVAFALGAFHSPHSQRETDMMKHLVLWIIQVRTGLKRKEK